MISGVQLKFDAGQPMQASPHTATSLHPREARYSHEDFESSQAVQKKVDGIVSNRTVCNSEHPDLAASMVH